MYILLLAKRAPPIIQAEFLLLFLLNDVSRLSIATAVLMQFANLTQLEFCDEVYMTSQKGLL
jgi:hypothetical protein